MNDDPDIGGIPPSEKGAPNGVCPLDAGAKVSTTYLPPSIVGAIYFKGTWDASTGAYPVAPTQGDYYVISVEGTISGVLYKVQDWMICQSTGPDVWDKIDAQSLNIPIRGFALNFSNNPPGAPADGETWLIGSVPTGAWVGHADEVATWGATAAAWIFETPSNGWTYYVTTLNHYYITTGAGWVPLLSVSGAVENEISKYDANGLPTTSKVKLIYETRDVPNTGNDYIEIGSFAQNEGTFSLIVSVSAKDAAPGLTGADLYFIVGKYNQTSGLWELAYPLQQQESHSQLCVMINNNVLSLRLIAITSTVSDVTVRVQIIDIGVGDAVFSAASGTGTMSLPSTIYDTTVLSQKDGKVEAFGVLNMNSNLIKEVTDPVDAQDAATKNYVDTFPTKCLSPLQIGAGDWIPFGVGLIGWDYIGNRLAIRHRGTGDATVGIFRGEKILPADFTGFPSTPLDIYVRRNAVTTITITMYKNGVADSTINGTDITPTAADTWEKKTLTPGSTYAAEDTVVLEVTSTCDAGEINYISTAKLEVN